MQVESIRPYAGQIDPHRELELLDSLAANPHESLAVLADGVARVFRAGWALVLGAPVGGQAARARRGQRPHPRSRRCRCRGGRRGRPARSTPTTTGRRPDWDRLGTELAVAPLGDGALLVGRPALRWLPSELVRLQHLAAIAAIGHRATADRDLRGHAVPTTSAAMPPGPPTDIPDQTGRTFVVTGANSGLGEATARALAAHGARRDPGLPQRRPRPRRPPRA